jgi:hypothetical protein
VPRQRGLVVGATTAFTALGLRRYRRAAAGG